MVGSENGGILDRIEEDLGCEALRGLRYEITRSVVPFVRCSVAMLVQVCQGSTAALLFYFLVRVLARPKEVVKPFKVDLIRGKVATYATLSGIPLSTMLVASDLKKETALYPRLNMPIH